MRRLTKMSLKRKNCLFLIPFLHTFHRSPSRMKIRPGTSNTYTLRWEEGQRYLKDYVIDLIDYINGVKTAHVSHRTCTCTHTFEQCPSWYLCGLVVLWVSTTISKDMNYNIECAKSLYARLVHVNGFQSSLHTMYVVYMTYGYIKVIPNNSLLLQWTCSVFLWSSRCWSRTVPVLLLPENQESKEYPSATWMFNMILIQGPSVLDIRGHERLTFTALTRIHTVIAGFYLG